MSKLSKTDYILYRDCPHNTWVKWHNKEEYAKHEPSDFEKSLAVTGNEVEELARGLFPNGFLVEKRSDNAQELTKKLIAERTPVIFQAVFSTQRFLAAADVLKWNNDAQAYDIYEIKMSSTEEELVDGKIKKNSKKEEQFEHDLAFQTIVIESCSVPLNKKNLIRLNNEYVRYGELDLEKLFVIENKTDEINDIKEQVTLEMEEAFNFLSKETTPPSPCNCYYKGRSSHCTTFSFINPEVPPYSVHDLNRIGNSKAYLTELLEEGVLSINDVPMDDRLKGKKFNQVVTHKKQSPIANLDTLKEELDNLSFPLYFLDYETYPTAIPLYDGYHPYQHIVFQYSLHVVDNASAEPKHFECIVLTGDPAEEIAKSLKSNIGNTGNIISWYKNFENSRNEELGSLLPGYKDFFQRLIDRTYDLMDVVENQHYVHPDFRGKSSIKKVLPVLVPHLSYKVLEVQSGTDAIEAYRQITEGILTGEELEQKKIQMLEYCKLDTLAMYELWKFFVSLVRK